MLIGEGMASFHRDARNSLFDPGDSRQRPSFRRRGGDESGLNLSPSRTVLRFLLFLALAVLLNCSWFRAASAASKPESTRPNIVLIFADDLGWADLPSYGNRIIQTPNIDALAAAGARFTRFYATPVCSPSRAELQTGQYAARLGITDFIPGHWRPFERVVTPRPASKLPETATTIGEALQRQGYATGYFGKWHLGEVGLLPGSRGYQETLINIGLNHLVDNSTPSIDVIGDRAQQFIATHRGHPFFLMLSPSQPHVPLRAERRKIDKYQARLASAGATSPDPIYAAMVDDLDSLVGRVMRALDANALSESTMLIFLSDNGGLEHLDLGLGNPVTSNAPLRGEKGTIYEGGLRVPFIVRWPGMIAPGSLRTSPAAIYDLLPTFLDMAGSPASASRNLDGHSLLPLLRGKDGDTPERPLYFHYPHYHHGRPAGAIIHAQWKLIEFLDDGSIELYDLSHDIGEQHNLAAKDPGRVKRLRNQLANWRMQVAARLPVSNPSYDPARAGEWWDWASRKPVDMKSFATMLKRGELLPEHPANSPH